MSAPQNDNFAGRVAIVTGAGSGIGRETTLRLAAAGAKVLAVDINGDAAAGTQSMAAGTVSAHVADVSDGAQVRGYVDAVVAKWGAPQLFFNNAGVEGVHKSIIDTTEDEWLTVQGINLNSMFWGLKYVLPHMRDAGEGAVVNTGSILSLKAAPDRSDYVVNKHAVLGLTRSAASEMAPFGVRVNCVCPGPINTPLMRRSEILVNPDDPDHERHRFESGTPMGRYGQPAEIAETVLFLLRPHVTYLTGAAIAIDGGITSV